MNFPYQIVCFLGREPEIGENVYSGENGWYPQIALKRRFGELDNEETALDQIAKLAKSIQPIKVVSSSTTKPEDMPVEIIPIQKNEEIQAIHELLFKNLKPSKYPSREGGSYSPHITVSWDGKRVIDVEEYENSEWTISKVWMLKDQENGQTVAYKSFELQD